MDLILAAALGLSLAANFALAFLLRRSRKKPHPQVTRTVTAEEVLHDLTRAGQTVVRIERIDSDSLFMRRF